MSIIAITILIFYFGVISSTTIDPNGINFIQQATEAWLKFKMENLRQFTVDEDLFRFDIFKENLKRIQELSKKFQNGLIQFRVTITQFADLSKEEFMSKHLTLKVPTSRFRRDSRGNRTVRQLPPSLDWRNSGAVTAVKSQGGCASCWAFSAIASLEGQYYRRFGTLVSLSEQNLIDCSRDQTNNGCNGGWMANAFQYVSTHVVTTENEYPYVGTRQDCRATNNGNNVKLSISGYRMVDSNEQSLQETVANIGPVSVAIDAANLQFYAGGVFRDDECSSRVNHGVVIIGYGNENGRDYWLIKNSWGANWGEQGYFKLMRNKGNMCNVASYAMYPLL